MYAFARECLKKKELLFQTQKRKKKLNWKINIVFLIDLGERKKKLFQLIQSFNERKKEEINRKESDFKDIKRK